MDWPQARYCSRCGGWLTERFVPVENCTRLVCQLCGRINYLNPKAVAGAIPEMDGAAVLLRRAIEPRIGTWTFPGGFVDLGESVAQAAIRETREEVNLEVDLASILNVYSNADSPVVLVVYRATVRGGELGAGPEALEVATFTPDSIPWSELSFWTTTAALEDWVREVTAPPGVRPHHLIY